MQNWKRYLKDNSLPWLLEPVNPYVRFWTMVDILEQSLSNPEVQETRTAVAQQPLVKELYSLQHPDGF